MLLHKVFHYFLMSHYYTIRIFTKRFFIPRKEILFRKSIAHYSFFKILSSWKYNGASEPLMSHLKFLETSPDAWEFEFKRIWLIYITCLLEHNDKEEALRVLEKYLLYFDDSNLAHFLPVAKLAFEQGIKNSLIEKGCYVFQLLEEGRRNNNFETMIKKAKRIAIVGGGTTEIGKRKGQEIDDHDLVIRCNDYNNSQFYDDYGKRTDIWFKIYFQNANNYKFTDTCKLHAVRNDIWHEYLDMNTFNLYEKQIENYDYVDLKIKHKIFNAFPHRTIDYSTGVVPILWIYLLLGNFDNVDIYGYSFLDKSNNLKFTHYYNPFSDYTIKYNEVQPYYQHDFAYEIKLLRSIYKK